MAVPRLSALFMLSSLLDPYARFQYAVLVVRVVPSSVKLKVPANALFRTMTWSAIHESGMLPTIESMRITCTHTPTLGLVTAMAPTASRFFWLSAIKRSRRRCCTRVGGAALQRLQAARHTQVCASIHQGLPDAASQKLHGLPSHESTTSNFMCHTTEGGVLRTSSPVQFVPAWPPLQQQRRWQVQWTVAAARSQGLPG